MAWIFPSDPKLGFSSDLKTGLKTWPPFGESNGHDLKKLEEMGYLEVQGSSNSYVWHMVTAGRNIPVSRWLISMVSRSTMDGVVPLGL